MKTIYFLTSTFIMLLIGGYSMGQVQMQDTTQAMQAAKDLSPKATKFIEEAATGGMMEVKLGEMAQEKASDQEVKDFGQRMVTDHSKANDALKAMAEEKSVTLPEAMTSKQQQTVDKLSKLSGAAFDREYMSTMVKDHNKDVKAFEKASENIKDMAVQEFALETLPVLKEHLQMAEDIEQQLENS